MRVVVLGVGGIGGTLAARLTRAGVEVTPVTGNEAIAAALAASGYRVRELDKTDWTVPVNRPPRVALAPEDGQFDLCLLATKATTMQEALAKAAPNLAPGAEVVCLQNGLPESFAAEVVGAERVVGCVVGWGASMVEPGLYQRTSRGGLQLERDCAAAAVLGQVEETTVSGDFVGVRWSKLALNCATSTVGAVGGKRLGALLARRFVRRLVLEVWTEVAAVARASEVRMALVGGTLDVDKMALTDREKVAPLGSPALAWKHSILLAVGMKYRRMRSSMLYALERGRRPEIDFLNGEVVRRGAALGVPTPVNARLIAAVAAIAAGTEASSLEHLRRVYDELAAPATAKAA